MESLEGMVLLGGVPATTEGGRRHTATGTADPCALHTHHGRRPWRGPASRRVGQVVSVRSCRWGRVGQAPPATAAMIDTVSPSATGVASPSRKRTSSSDT